MLTFLEFRSWLCSLGDLLFPSIPQFPLVDNGGDNTVPSESLSGAWNAAAGYIVSSQSMYAVH